MALGTILQVAGTLGSAFLGQKKAPKRAPYEKVDVGQVAKDTMKTNIELFDDSSSLAEKTNTFNQSEANRLAELAMPGFSKLQASLTSRIQQDLDNEGRLDPEQIKQIERFAAERGITTGTSGGIRDLSLVRDFGFSAIEAKQADRLRALQSIQSLTGMTARVSPTSPMYGLLDPNAAISGAFRNAENAQQELQGHYNAKAAASNENRSMWANAFGTTMGIAGGAWSKWQEARAGSIQSTVLSNAAPDGATMTPYVVRG